MGYDVVLDEYVPARCSDVARGLSAHGLVMKESLDGGCVRDRGGCWQKNKCMFWLRFLIALHFQLFNQCAKDTQNELHQLQRLLL